MFARHITFRNLRSVQRSAFTLVELLVVITILVILTTLTVTAINFSLDSERIRSGARQIQSYLEGARDRAIYARQPRGVRFLVDQTNNNTVTSMVFIGPSDRPYDQGTIQLERLDDFDNTTITPGPPMGPPDGIADSPDVRLIRGNGTGWFNLKQRGLLEDGSRIKIIRQTGNGEWYTVLTARLTATDELLELTIPYIDGGNTPNAQIVAYDPADGPQDYQLELPPLPLDGEDPALLPGGIVIDLPNSKLPSDWQSGGNFISRMDIMFSPRGAAIGTASAQGVLHFLLGEAASVDFGLPIEASYWQASASYNAGDWVVPNPRNGFMYRAQGAGSSGGAAPVWPEKIGQTVVDSGVTWEAFEIGDRILVTLFPRTGAISSHQVYLYDPAVDTAMDPFRYSEVGEVAGE